MLTATFALGIVRTSGMTNHHTDSSAPAPGPISEAQALAVSEYAYVLSHGKVEIEGGPAKSAGWSQSGRRISGCNGTQ